MSKPRQLETVSRGMRFEYHDAVHTGTLPVVPETLRKAALVTSWVRNQQYQRTMLKPCRSITGGTFGGWRGGKHPSLPYESKKSNTREGAESKMHCKQTA